MVQLPGSAFHSNRDAGAFVAQLLGPDPLSGPYAVMKVRSHRCSQSILNA